MHTIACKTSQVNCRCRLGRNDLMATPSMISFSVNWGVAELKNMNLCLYFSLLFILCVVCSTGDRTYRNRFPDSGPYSPQLDSPTWRYRLPVLAATAENQSVQLVLATAERYLPTSVDVRLLYPSSSDQWYPMTQACRSERDSAVSLQQQQQQQSGRSIVNNDTLWTMTMKRPFDHHSSSSVLQISSRTPVVLSVVYLGSCSSVYALPYYALGVVYEVITWSPVGQSSASAQATFTVVSQNSNADPTDIYIRFPHAVFNSSTSDAKCNIRFGSVVHLQCGDVIRLMLLGTESATFFSSDVDLSGTTIEASDRVAIFATNEGISIGPAIGVIDSTSSQLFPVSAWGKTYAVAPIPDNGRSGFSVRITSGGHDGVSIAVTVNATSKSYTLRSHEALTVDVPDNSATYIRASAPIQVVQYVRGATVSTDSGAPASLVLPAVELFDTVYQFVDSPGNYVSYVVIVVDSANRSGLLLNGFPLDPIGRQWVEIGGNSGLVTSALALSAPALTTLQHQFNVPFGAYRYSYIRGQCAFAYPAGARFFHPNQSVPVPPVVNQSTTTTASPISTTPPRPTEPVNASCEHDNMGTEFVLAFIENVAGGVAHHLQVYPASFSRSPSVEVNIELPVNSSAGIWNESVQLATSLSSLPIVVEVPPDVELSGIGMSKKAVVVRAAEPIGLYGMSIALNGSCDGFVALPVSSLGYIYYVINYQITSYQSEFGIVAVEDNTSVEITLNPNAFPTNQIEWIDGITYFNYEIGRNTIKIQMMKYETVQIQDAGDLAGTRIQSTRPIAVFSGNNYSPGNPKLELPVHLVEQLPPVTDWGSTFYLVPLPGVVTGYTFRLVTSTPNNVVTIQNSTVVLSYPGHVHTVNQMDGRCVVVKSSQTLLVTQFAGGTENTGHHAMQIIPPSELYRSWYTFSTEQGDELSSFNHYVLVVVDQSAVDGLYIDETPINRFHVSWMNFDAPDSNKVGGAVRIESGVHIIRQRDDVPFGASVYGHSATSWCTYAYPAGMCLRTPGNQTTSPSTSGR